ncbi:hypothetical protein LSAT2_019241, partial [Lamellibrachia satsuma]
ITKQTVTRLQPGSRQRQDSKQISTGITTETVNIPQPGSRQRQQADLNRDHDRDSE